MLKIYKKINKTISNTYGSIEINNIKNLNKPFLLCLSGYNNYDKSIFGIIREGAHAARVYTTQEKAAGFKIETMPIDFLGVRFEKDEHFNENYQELSANFLLPYLEMHGINQHAIEKQARRINLFTFDNGIITYKKTEKELYKGLEKDGFSSEIIEKILSQITVIALGTNEDLSDMLATNIKFIDLNDKETQTIALEEYRTVLITKRTCSMYVPERNKNAFTYYFLGSGKHVAKEYLKDECMAKTAISAITSLFLQNSLANRKTQKLLTISKEEMVDPLYYYGANLYPIDRTLCLLDQEIKYDQAPKYTQEEYIIRKELDNACKLIQKNKLIVENREKEYKDISNRMTTIINNMREYSSDTTYYQILTASNLWFPKEDVLKKESDREIRKKYEKAGTKKNNNVSQKAKAKTKERTKNKKTN